MSNLKAKVGQRVQPRSTIPTVSADLVLSPEPMSILANRSYQLRNRVITQVLVQWQGESKEDATWENLFDLQQKFPHLVGKVVRIVCISYFIELVDWFISSFM